MRVRWVSDGAQKKKRRLLEFLLKGSTALVQAKMDEAEHPIKGLGIADAEVKHGTQTPLALKI